MPLPPVEEGGLTDGNPQPEDNLLTFDGGIGFDGSATVYIRQNWGDAWTLNDQLVCVSLNWAAAPTIPTAQLIYRYGNTLERDSTTVLRAKISIGGYYVRIVVDCADGDRVWHGFVDDSADEPFGYVARSTFQDPTGVQTFSCVGIIAALDRSPILTSHFAATGGFVGAGLTGMRVALSAPLFNPRSKISDEPGELRQIKNRTASEVTVPTWPPVVEPDYPATLPDPARTSYLLMWDDLYNYFTDGEYWSSKNIAQYLVSFAGPRDGVSDERLPIWVFDPDAALPDWDRPDLDCEGLTLKGALDQLMSLRQSIGYWVWVDDLSNRIVVQPFTALAASLTVATGKTIAANARWLNVKCDTDPATSFTLQRSESAVANQVLVRGAKRILVTTLRPTGDSTASLSNGWTSTLATDYNTEFGALLSSPLIRERNSARDALEQGRYRALWRNFVVTPSWTWSDPDNNPLFRVDFPDTSGTYATNARYLPYPANMRILPNLPLKAGVNYLDGDAQNLHAASKAQFRDIEVYGRTHGANFTGTCTGRPNIWTERGKRDVLYDMFDPDYQLDVKPLNSDVGFGVKINVAGAFQGILGGNSGASHIPVLPTASLSVTLAVEEDRYLEAAWPATISTDVDGVLRRTFDFGDEYQCIELGAKTIVGIAGDAFQQNTSRLYVRNDYDRLLELAKQLHNWVSTARSIARISSRRLTAKLWPGQLIKKLNPTAGHEAECNCVITEVSMSFPIGTAESPGKPTMQVVTSRGEIDPLFFQPRLS